MPRCKDVDGRDEPAHDEHISQLAPSRHRGYFERVAPFV
jgi:hypothetical protein